MKTIFIVANWKSNKTTQEVHDWIETFANNQIQHENKTIIICPAFLFLPLLKPYTVTNDSFLKLGAQNISPFDEGAYTGEVNGKQLKEFVNYVLIGHSERRKFFHEDEKVLAAKVLQAKENSLESIYCVGSQDDAVAEGVKIVAYEPLEAIGSGKPDTAQNANEVARKIKEKNPHVLHVLYGGSVTAKNVLEFTKAEYLDGVLVGGASLDVKAFTEIIENT
ncbi:MAG TPA: triose-phosphate isomerase family protein [Candidatus Saccharimonadales bacterium]|nr:triose-phosphate isomerase family protein [Candidatus Saccharimonadales bacterium]